MLKACSTWLVWNTVSNYSPTELDLMEKASESSPFLFDKYASVRVLNWLIYYIGWDIDVEL